MIAARAERPALRRGEIAFRDVPDDAGGDVLLFTRSLDGASQLCAFNFGDTDSTVTDAPDARPVPALCESAHVSGRTLTLAPSGYFVGDLGKA